MRLLSSLQNRIFLACLAVALLSIAVTGRFVTGRVERQAEAELSRGLGEAAELVQEHHASRFEALALMARLVADLPKLKAAVATGDAPTVEPIALEYHLRVRSDLLVVTDAAGTPLATLGSDARPDPAAVREALAGRESIRFRRLPGRLLQVVTVPLTVGPEPPELLGTLGVGLAIDDALAREFSAVTASEIGFVHDGVLLASTLPGLGAVPEHLPPPGQMARVQVGDAEYEALRQPLGDAAGGRPDAVILQSRTERLAFLETFRTVLVVAAVVAALLAVMLSYVVARTVTGPLNALTTTMREMSATGDLSRRLEPRQGWWYDEDAAVLAAAFGSLTESIRRFQQEAVLRRRLTDLGRLSTVIAHEIRNPLMIIKGALRSLRRRELPEAERCEALAEIDGEVGRLDRIVGDVLDFARPVRIEPRPTDLNAVCAEVAESTLGGDGEGYALQLAPDLGEIVTDAERVRTVLVNALTNAAEALGDEPRRRPTGTAPIRIVTAPLEGGGAAVEVVDEGAGIAPEDLPRIFEPYFTTRRTGTGLGLAICRNVADALGGRIAAESVPGRGTTLRLELPARAPAGPAEAS